MTYPLRRAHLVVRPVGAELVIYDVRHARAHRLNATTALVWRHCDGQTSVPELAALVARELGLPGASEDVVWLALDQLERARLLQAALARSPEERGLSRRQAIAFGLAGAMAFLLPGCESTTMPGAPLSTTPGGGPSRNVVTSPPPPASPPPPGSPPPPPPPPSSCEPSMTLRDIDLVGCKVECRVERTRDKEIAIFVAQVCEWRPGFLLTGEPKCSGQCDVRSNKCTPRLSFSWRIIEQKPANSATIVGSSTDRNVKVRATTQLGTYTLELTVTLQCRCGDKDVGAPLVQTKTRKFQVNQNCH